MTISNLGLDWGSDHDLQNDNAIDYKQCTEVRMCMCICHTFKNYSGIMSFSRYTYVLGFVIMTYQREMYLTGISYCWVIAAVISLASLVLIKK